MFKNTNNTRIIFHELHMDVFKDCPYTLMSRVIVENVELKVKNDRVILGCKNDVVIMNIPVDIMTDIDIIRYDNGVITITFSVGDINYRMVIKLYEDNKNMSAMILDCDLDFDQLFTLEGFV